jgi:hypothetical protein
MNPREHYEELKRIPKEVQKLEGITETNAKEFYDRNHTRWQIDWDSVITGDGVKLSQFERITLPLYGKYKYKQVKASETIQGLPLTELDFIRQESLLCNELQEKVKGEKNPIYYKRVETYLNYITNRYNELTKPPKLQKKTSYVWLMNADKELPELHSLMIESNLIAKETTLHQLIAIFTGQPIDNIEPIRWKQDNASELLYFISQLEQTTNIKSNPKKADYQRMAACFLKPDGQTFQANWKQLKQTITINLSKEKQDAIDRLIANF